MQLGHHAELHSGHPKLRQKMLLNEKGVNFDGPLFDLPGGTVKAAVGATFTSYHFGFLNLSQHQCQQPDRADQLRSGKPPSVGRVHPGEHSDLQ